MNMYHVTKDKTFKVETIEWLNILYINMKKEERRWK